MKSKFIFVLFALVIIAAMAISLAPASTVSAAGSVSVHIVKYDTDGVTVLDEETVNIAALETMPVQGDGTTHYYTQGPTFDPNNMWDPNKLSPGDSLKDKGALKGTSLKDLCDLVGGMDIQDTVSVKASDGYGDSFDYPNVYNTLGTDLNARQGKMVICWWKDGMYSGSGAGTWSDGMLLAFFPTVASVSTNPAANGKYIFGHQDMHDCLPQHNWHWYYDGSIQYPSTHGLSFKWVSEIKIYKGGANSWGVGLSGASNFTMTQAWFENGIACHTPAGNPAAFTYTDGTGNVWSGLPLWYVCGVVDDANMHGPGSFNDSLYYDVKVTAKDGYNYTFPSTTIARNNNYLLANKLNGNPLPEDKYPLKLVSPDFTTGGPSVAQIASISLLNISTTPPVTPTPTPGTADWPLLLVGEHSYNMSKAAFESGVSCHGATTFTDDTNNVWSGLPLWLLVGYVDDANQHGPDAFNDELVSSNYRVKVTAADGYYQYFNIADVARNNNIFVANKLNGANLPATTGTPPHPAYPLKITGSAISSGSRVGAVVKIELVDLPAPAAPAWDLNNDHKCNVSDMVVIGLHWGQSGTVGWIPADVNKDGTVNIGDIAALGLHWGQTW